MAVESVFSQTFSDWELIVADDGSFGEARRYLREVSDPRVTVLWLGHSGNPARVRNAGIARARGEYLAFLDSDDVWAPRKLEKQMIVLGDHPDFGWCYTHSDWINETGDPETPPPPRYPGEGWILEPLLRDPQVQIGMPGLVARRKLVLDAGGFDEQQRFAEDLDLFLRLAIRSQVVVVPEILYSIRLHRGHYSDDSVGLWQSRMRLYGKMARLVQDPELQAFCRVKRAHESLSVARLAGARGDELTVWRTLGLALSFSWPYPAWWLGALKAVVRVRLPKALLSRYRQWRRSHVGRA